MSGGPFRIELDEEGFLSPADAPAVDDGASATGAAMQTVAGVAARRPARLARWFWALFTGFVGLAASVAAWDFVTGLLARNPVLGWAAAALGAGLALVLLIVALREAAALSRLSRIDRVQHRAREAIVASDIEAARKLAGDLGRLYAGRAETAWAGDGLKAAVASAVDADTLLEEVERKLLDPLDTAARREVEAAARQVAAITALVPLAFADVLAAASANLRMIRRIAEVYGGRGGTLGNLRLTRAVFSHLVATGAVAVGDDMLSSIGGGHLVSRLSRRFGEGLINGALTARVGVAAIEVCRPLPFAALKRPTVRGIVGRALAGVFDGVSGKG